jgi:hypothetical protein
VRLPGTGATTAGRVVARPARQPWRGCCGRR